LDFSTKIRKGWLPVKKILALLVIACFVVTLSVGCGSSATTGGKKADDTKKKADS
jgi:hypothetical protein